MIIICLEDQTVNATHLCLAAGLKSQDVRKRLVTCSITSHHAYRGYHALQGTYVTYVDGLTICSELCLAVNTAYHTLLDFVDANFPKAVAGPGSPESPHNVNTTTITTEEQESEEAESIFPLPRAEDAAARNQQNFLDTNLW